MRFRYPILAVMLFGLGFPRMVFSQFLYWDFHDIISDNRMSGAYPDMEVESNGRVHLTYWNQHEDRLIYARRGPSDTSWFRQYVDAAHPNGYRSAIKLDANGKPHVVFQENQNGYVQVRYAYLDNNGAWVVESIPGDPVIGWGQYGPNGSINGSLRVKHSLDLEFNEFGQPQVVFFDGWSDISAFSPCTNSSNYHFRLQQGIRRGPNNWATQSFGEIPDVRLSCGTNASPYPLPQGDRYGEFCQLLQRKDNKMQVFCLSRFNNRVLNFRQQSATSDTTWIRGETDSLGRMQPAWMWSDRFFTIEGISAQEDPSGQVHLSYSTSLFFGENFFAGALGVNDMVYSRIIDDTTIFYHSFGTGTYRNYSNIATQGSDSVFIVYSNLSSQQFLMQESTDGGATWTSDTLRSGVGSYYSPTKIAQDTLFVLVFDEASEKLLLCKRALNGGEWIEQVINESQNYGAVLDASIVPISGDTLYSAVFSDGFGGGLFWAQATASGGYNFSVEPLVEDGAPIRALAIGRYSGGNLVAFSGGSEGVLTLGKEVAGNWVFETIDSTGALAFVDMQVDAIDTIRIVYSLVGDSCLKQAFRHVNDNSWSIGTVNCDSLGAGQYPSLQLDATGKPSIAFFDPSSNSLFYASLGQQGEWLLDTVHSGGFSAIGKFASMRLDSAGRPKIAYLDEQQTSVWLAEWDGATWSLSLVDSVPVTNIGRPIELEIDGYGKVWVAYNYYSNFEKVKLMHRDNGWREVAVNTTGQIADAFVFRISGSSLNVFGKKNALQNTGVAFIRSANGLYVDVQPASENQKGQLSISIFPNPARSVAQILLESSRTVKTDAVIHDLWGREVERVWTSRTLQAGQEQLELSLNHLPAGTYFLVVSSESGNVAAKIILLP
jgi:hypothetical protein